MNPDTVYWTLCSFTPNVFLTSSVLQLVILPLGTAHTDSRGRICHESATT
jgi:hypothetical protein